MSRTSTPSSRLDILVHSRRHHPITKMTAQIRGRAQIDLSPKQGTHFKFHAGQAHQTRNFSRIEFHKDINIAVGTEVIPQDRTKKSHAAYAALTAKGRQTFMIQ